MPGRTSADQIEALRKQQLEIAKRIRDVEAKTRERNRHNELRRESLAGRLVLDHLANYPEDGVSTAVLALLDKSLSKPADRALFPALATPPPAPSDT